MGTIEMMPVYKDSRFGDPRLPPTFWAKVLRTPTCWLWTGADNGAGHGQTTVRRKRRYAHRATCEVFNGPIPPKYVVDHLCEHPPCVRPDHLEAVTHRVNLQRAAKRGTKTECPHGHAMTPENTYIYGSQYECRTCRRVRSSAWSRKKRAVTACR